MNDEAQFTVRIGIDDPMVRERVAAMLRQISGLRIVSAGEAADLAVVAPAERESNVEASLTPRELDVLRLIAEGASNKTIARRLGISTHTAKFHVGRLLDKLDASGRTDALAHAARLGVIHL